MVAPEPLSEQDLEAVRAELSAGKPSTVWFTPASVGVPVGGSAKVVSVDEVAEGEFIQVRPAGSRDTMFCSPSELTRTRPPRKRKPQSPPPAEEPAKEAVAAPASTPPPAVAEGTDNPASRAATPAKGARRALAVPAEETAPPAPAKGAERRRAPGGASAARPTEVTVTLVASIEGEWTVEVLVGKKRTVRPTPVQPADVAKAARSLPAAVTEAIEASLAAARQRQLDRVEQLRAELEAAQHALRELSG